MEASLDFFTLDELINEIARRKKSVLVVVRDDVDKDSEHHETWFRGGRVNAVGLAYLAIQELSNMQRPMNTQRSEDA